MSPDQRAEIESRINEYADELQDLTMSGWLAGPNEWKKLSESRQRISLLLDEATSC